MMEDRESPEVAELMGKVDPEAARYNVDSTPSFLAGPPDGRLRKLQPEQLDYESFKTVFDAALKLDRGAVKAAGGSPAIATGTAASGDAAWSARSIA